MTDVHSPTPANESLRHQQRMQLQGTLTSLGAWVVVIIPIVLLAIIIFAAVMEPSAGMSTPGRIAIAFGGAALLFCMIAAPHLLGQAVRFRERAMWRAA